MNRVASLMQNAIEEGVFPGAVVWASKDGKSVFTEAYGVTDFFSQTPVAIDTIYDLASLTKPLVTTLIVLKLVQEKKLSLSDPVGKHLSFFVNTSKANITIEQLLRHQSGLPAWAPLWKSLQEKPGDKNKALLSSIYNLPHAINSEKMTIYSDIGFILLQKVVEEIGQKSLDRLAEEWIFTPLKTDLFFRPMDRKMPLYKIAATERCALRKDIIHGSVHDNNAWAMEGIAGHAGLFGNAKEVHVLLTALSDIFHASENKYGFDPSWIRYFFMRLGPSRPLGFDCPSENMPSCGKCFSPKTVGHLGFTGTSFWMDLEEKIIIILLSNRVHPDQHNDKIKAFRPILHDMLYAYVQNQSK